MVLRILRGNFQRASGGARSTLRTVVGNFLDILKGAAIFLALLAVEC